MALGEEGDAAAPAQPAAPPPPGSSGDDEGGSLLDVWSSLLLALLAAFLSWLWYGRHDGHQPPEGTLQGEARPAPELLRERRECVVSETKSTDVSSPHEPVGNQLGPPGDHSAPDIPRESPEAELSVKESSTALMNYKEYLSTEALSHPISASKPSQSQDAEMHGTGISSEPDVPRVNHEERCKEQLCHNSVDHDEWEMVPQHSAWREATRKRGSDDVSSSRDLEQAKRVAAVPPMPQTVHVTFRVHYITHVEAQLIAITGDHECLGQWHHYVPLQCDKNGFWSDSVVLPVDTRLEWKFIVVENGKVRRWEECDNRILVTENEDCLAHKWWGYH
ncbi:starch-binding domain-containing protein 1 [Tiliqua scincoides]|uniref:starch-binding domain-containing protein 1 n=1 Tax=Tiliqua scincoides TaxID=71010 RepID=UPI00346275C1